MSRDDVARTVGNWWKVDAVDLPVTTTDSIDVTWPCHKPYPRFSYYQQTQLNPTPYGLETTAKDQYVITKRRISPKTSHDQKTKIECTNPRGEETKKRGPETAVKHVDVGSNSL